MHNGSDQFGKNVLRDALSLASIAETEVEVLAATQKIDVYSVPDPARHAERAARDRAGGAAAHPGDAAAAVAGQGGVVMPFWYTSGSRATHRQRRRKTT